MIDLKPATPPKPLIRVMLLLRYGEEDDGKSAVAQTIMQTMWPDYEVQVVDSASAFFAAKNKVGGGFAGWVRYAASDVDASGPTFHAFAVADPTIGFTSGEIIEKAGAHGRPCFLLDLQQRSWAQVTKLEAVEGGKKKHDWRVTG